MSFSNKDYIKNKQASSEMAKTIERWYHSRGYPQVKIWVEEEKQVSPYGTKLPSNFYVRGNVVFNVDTIEKGMVE